MTKSPRSLRNQVLLYLAVVFLPAVAVIAGWLYAYRGLLFGP